MKGHPLDLLYAPVATLQRPLSRLVFGTARLQDTPGDRHLLDHILRLGCTTFDTARVYGHAEKCLGKWIRERSLHDVVTIVTKCGHPSDRARLRHSDLLTDINASREALGLDTLDVVLLHRDDPCVPTGEIIESLNEILRAHAIRAFGVSNWEVKRIVDAQFYADRKNLQGLCISSSHFSLAPWTREPWTGCVTVSGASKLQAREWYNKTSFPLMAWSSLGAGFFSEKIARLTANSTELASYSMNSVYASPENFERLARVSSLALKANVSIAEIALAYVFNQPMNIFAVTSTRDPSHFLQNINALHIQLCDREVRWLNLKDG